MPPIAPPPSLPPLPPPTGSCKQILDYGLSTGSGKYQLSTASGPVTVECDMDRQGGGWTLGVKSWYCAGLTSTGAVGSIEDALTRKGQPYKLSDDVIREIIGPGQKMDVLFDQNGYNSAYSGGNHEYVVIRGYTAEWTWGGVVPESSTTTTMTSYRRTDDAVAAHFNFNCGGVGGRGINCLNVASGSINPQGGSGCFINMGSHSDGGWYHLYMFDTNEDSYMYVCNGAQHSSGFDMNHRCARPSPRLE